MYTCCRTGTCFPGRNCQRASQLRRRGICSAASASGENLSVRTAGGRTQIKPKPGSGDRKRTRVSRHSSLGPRSVILRSEQGSSPPTQCTNAGKARLLTNRTKCLPILTLNQSIRRCQTCSGGATAMNLAECFESVSRSEFFKPLTLSRLRKGRKRERKGACVDTTTAER
jgi:hypothetical protein